MVDNIGKKLKDLRKASGLSQKELARKINITPPNLSQWESMAIPPLEGIIKVCDGLNFPLWQLFLDNDTNVEQYLPSWIKQEHIYFLKELSALPEDVQKQMLINFSGIISLRKLL